MSDRIDRLIETMERMERLLTRFELDMAGRLYVVDYQAGITMLCEEFDAEMRGLMQVTSRGDGTMHASSRSFGFAISHSKTGEST